MQEDLRSERIKSLSPWSPGVKCRWNRGKGRFFWISSGRVFYQQRPLLISAAYGDIISSERCVPRNNKRSVPLCRIAFLKRHDLSGFQDNSFSFSGCMSGFCNIVFQKWIHQSGNSQILLQSWKSLPRIRGKIFRCRNYMPWIWGTFMPGGWKSASNPREDFPRSELFALNLRHVYAQGWKSALNLREDFPRSEMFALNLRHVSPKLEWFPPDLGHINEHPKWSAPNLGHDFFCSWTPHGLLIDLSILPYEILYTSSIPLGLEQP